MIGLCAALFSLWLAPAGASPGTGDAVSTSAQRPAQQQVLTWTADDRMDEYASAPATAKPGPATIVFENSENTGNTSGMSHTLTFDTSSPEYNNDVQLNIVASPFDANGGRYEVEVTLSPGKYRYYCAIPGHGEMQGVLVVTEDGGGEEDTTPPEVTAEVTGDQDEEGNYIGSATVKISAQDSGSGVDTVEYDLDEAGFEPYTEPLTINEPGDHTVHYRATDNAGNTSETGSVTFTVVEGDTEDTTPPEVTAEVTGDQDEEGNYIGSATVKISAQDSGSGVDTVEYDLDEAGFEPYTEPLTINEPGDHTVHYRATDNAGNTSETGSVTFTVVEGDTEDTTPPEVTVQLTGSQDAQWNYVDSATVALSAHDPDSGVHFLRYSLDGGSYTAYGEPIVVNEPGEHTVLYHAVDHAGNRSEDGKVTFTVVVAEGDACPASDIRDTLVIKGHDSTVANVDTGNGCTLNDLIDEHAEYPNQGAFLAHVTKVTNDLVADGVISDSEQRRILRAAENSGVGE
ncbi:copper binding protein, plastocyanin/azurin family [Saccharomonospora viridis DSM 43017]|uniref:Copper binding protein, plastocyanin/azurin family n=1 Tax=Saccharomonospora viridis (strain ATCC 15386 / DSM 43017 / JCM 3036 / CCUG 5913 / NBRC 12207 / NCIMB 9602 / P101) TaxID=471857 RepID=C7MW33_SACVD|nr:copper binding protein, plastocyanin/azurin family [Saccharomonospora viridis DSM 43017]